MDKKRGRRGQNRVRFGPGHVVIECPFCLNILSLCLINHNHIFHSFLVQFSFKYQKFPSRAQSKQNQNHFEKTGLKSSELSESLNYCPKKYLSLIYIYRRSHRIYWSLCSYWRKSSFKYSKKSSLETPYKRQIYLQYWKWPRMDHWSFERYGNTGCGVSSSGIQHQKNWPKAKIFKETIFVMGGWRAYKIWAYFYKTNFFVLELNEK